MRTSAPGATEPARRGAGFTLVELLAVLAIAGIASAAIVLAIPDGRGSLAAEAERFAARVDAAQEQAVLESRAIALEVDADGYLFRRREGVGWRVLRTHRWTNGAAGAPGQSLFDSTGLVEPLAVELVRGPERARIDIAADGGVHVAR